MKIDSTLDIGDRKIRNRFFLGTGKFKSKEVMRESIEKAEVEVVTVSMRRVDVDRSSENILNFIPEKTILMVNTSGARNATEAIRIARLAKEAAGVKWIKVEVINDSKYLLPDNNETLKAVETLVGEGYTVLPYMNPDLYMAREMEKVGAAAIMPLGSLIGSGDGLEAEMFIRILIEEISVPIIVDAGIGAPSHAAMAMEMGAGGVLANTAVANAEDSVLAAIAFSKAVEAGRMAFIGNLKNPEKGASPSSPLSGFLFEN